MESLDLDVNEAASSSSLLFPKNSSDLNTVVADALIQPGLQLCSKRHEDLVKNYHPNAQMSSTIVDLSKKIRDMTSENTCLKLKLKQAQAENEALQRQNAEITESAAEKPTSTLAAGGNESSPSISAQDVSSVNQKLANITSKMMEYRRQAQQLRIENKAALQALCAEVGDGATPQTVLHTVNHFSWRGRQQEIVKLQNKIAELKKKLCRSQGLTSCNSTLPRIQGTGDHICPSTNLATARSLGGDRNNNALVAKCSTASLFSLTSAPSLRRNLNVVEQEQNRHEKLDQLSMELKNTVEELRLASTSKKAMKARVRTLEEQAKHYKAHIAALKSQVHEKNQLLQQQISQASAGDLEANMLKDRLRASKEAWNEEIWTLQQQLKKERDQVSELQKQFQQQLQQAKPVNGDDEAAEKERLCRQVDSLQSQLNVVQQALEQSGNEVKRVTALLQDHMLQAAEEREQQFDTQRHLIRAFAVIEDAERCIEKCLDVGRISDKETLASIEELGSMKRELKTGDLFLFERSNQSDPRKLKYRIKILKSELMLVKSNLQTAAVQRKQDLENFCQAIEKSREDLLDVVAKAISIKFPGPSEHQSVPQLSKN